MPLTRIETRFAKTRAQGRAALIAYVMAGDPDLEASYRALCALRDAGADVIELGAPFTDPMADGPAIQKAALRSLARGTTMRDTLALAARFRADDAETPLILMGYANPIHAMGFDAFAKAAAAAGIDGTIVVDMPPEEDAPLRAAYAPHDLAVIRLATPTTDAARMARIADGASGFVYFVSVAGVTGAGAADPAEIAERVSMVRRISGLPVAVGFGVRTPEQAAAMSRIADGVVVGSAFVAFAEAHAEGGTGQDGGAGMAASMGTLAGQLREALETAARA
jgi:tryptophan synthase alpha chain